MLRKLRPKRWRDWGLDARMKAVAVVPVIITFLAVMSVGYAFLRQSAKSEVAEQGELLAKMVASTAVFPLASGRNAEVYDIIKAAAYGRESIKGVEVHDLTKRKVAVIGFGDSVEQEMVHETPVTQEIDGDDVLSLLADSATQQSNKKLRTIGYVYVYTSAQYALERVTQKFIVLGIFGLMIVLCAAVIGGRMAQSLIRPLGEIKVALERMSKGAFDVQLEEPAQGQMRALQDTIIQVASDLKDGKERLEAKVRERTTALEEAKADMQALNARSIEQLEEERKRIGREIHDHVGATLMAIKVRAEGILEFAISEGKNATWDDLYDSADIIQKQALEFHQASRELINSLRPELLETMGLIPALRELIERYDGSQVMISLTADGDITELHKEHAIVAYRLVQEALTNILKHAHAKTALIDIAVCSLDARLYLKVIDDGRGMSPEATRKGRLGLKGMKERVSGIGGEMQLISPPGEGTSVKVWMPLQPLTQPEDEHAYT